MATSATSWATSYTSGITEETAQPARTRITGDLLASSLLYFPSSLLFTLTLNQARQGGLPRYRIQRKNKKGNQKKIQGF